MRGNARRVRNQALVYEAVMSPVARDVSRLVDRRCDDAVYMAYRRLISVSSEDWFAVRSDIGLDVVETSLDLHLVDRLTHSSRRS